MTLSEKQAVFARMIAQLIITADWLGYRVTFGDAYRSPAVTYGHKNSLHRKRLAIDLNLFTKNDAGTWVYKTSTKAHYPLGKYWESIGGVWGGRFGDGNHYSLGHGGMK